MHEKPSKQMGITQAQRFTTALKTSSWKQGNTPPPVGFFGFGIRSKEHGFVNKLRFGYKGEA